MMARPSVRALTEWRTPLGTMATNPARAMDENLVNGRATREVVMRECHVLRVEVSPAPTRQALNDGKAVCIEKRHGSLDQILSYTPLPIKPEDAGDICRYRPRRSGCSYRHRRTPRHGAALRCADYESGRALSERPTNRPQSPGIPPSGMPRNHRSLLLVENDC
jgi:hypothetical protein